MKDVNLNRKIFSVCAAVRLLLAFCLLVSLIPATFAQFGAQKRGGVKDVPYTYNGQQYVMRLIGNDVRQVLLNGQVILMLSNQTVVPYPGIDAHLVANAEDALKAYQGATGTAPASATSPSGAPPKPGLTVDDVVKMLDAGLSEDIILTKIHASNQSFDLSTDDLVRLKKAKASDAVIKTMMDAKASPAPASQPTAQPTATPPPASATPATTPAPAANSQSKKPGFFGQIGKGVKDSVQGKTVIDNVGLRNILPQWDPHKPLSEQFPHVAITVLYAPSGWTEPYATDPNVGGHNILPPCFKLEAVVWSDAQTSKKVGPFDWCSNKDEMLSQLEPTYLYSLAPVHAEGGYLTGINRTEGPAPPDKLLPNDRTTMDMQAKTNPQQRSKDLNLDATSRFAIMFANVRRDLGQTLTADGDYRVWIVSIKKAAGPSIF